MGEELGNKKGPEEPWSNPYGSLWTSLKRYWRSYGGTPAFLLSPYLHIAIILAFPCAYWPPAISWHERVIAIVPSMLGFILAGYAVLLAVGSESFLTRLAWRGKTGRSALENGSTSFMHFVLVQAMALIMALLAEPLSGPVLTLISNFEGPLQLTIKLFLRWLGWCGLLYSITCSLAATLRVFRMVGWFVRHVNEKTKKTSN